MIRCVNNIGRRFPSSSSTLRSSCGPQPQRNFTKSRLTNAPPSNKYNKGGKGNNNKLPPPPEIKLDLRKGNTILHEKAARAEELHAELDALLDMQARRRADEMNRAFGAGFFDFIRKSKSEMINIFAAFMCVMLAWQIASIRRGARKLLDDSSEREIRMEELKNVLRLLSSEEFSVRVANDYAQKMEEKKTAGNTNGDEGGKNILGKLLGKKSDKNNNTSFSYDENELRTIIQEQLQNSIGDIALSEVELSEKKLAELQREMGIQEEKKRRIAVPLTTTTTTSKDKDARLTMASDDDDSSLGSLNQVLLEVQKEDDKAVIKSRKGFI